MGKKSAVPTHKLQTILDTLKTQRTQNMVAKQAIYIMENIFSYIDHGVKILKNTIT